MTTLFELKASRSSSMVIATALAMAVHVVAAAWLVSMSLEAPLAERASLAPVVVFRKVAAAVKPATPSREPEPGGSGRRDGALDVRPRKRAVTAASVPLLEPMVAAHTPTFMMFANTVSGSGAEESAAFGFGKGTGVGRGSGSGMGNGDAGVSRARRAWFATTSWKCDRPENEDEAGRVVVKIRVTIEANGRPSAVFVTSPGPEIFNVRAVMCASVEEYVPALDFDGNAYTSDAEFGIEFLTAH